MSFSKIDDFKEKVKDWLLIFFFILALWGIFSGLEDEEGYDPEEVGASGKYIIK